MRVIKVLMIVASMLCVGCATKTALQQRCSNGDQVACDQVTRAQQEAESRPDLSRSPVIAPLVVGP